MSDNEGAQTVENTEGAEQQEQGQSFTQADVDRIVAERIKRERAKFADYDELKSKAGEKATVEERLAAMEKRATEAEVTALRANIASNHGISAEDRDLFLTGTTEEALTAQAERLAARDSEQKQKSPHVPREGNNPRPPDDERRATARQLFGSN